MCWDRQNISVTFGRVKFPEGNMEVEHFPVSISDLQDRYYEGEGLTMEERQALANFDSYRISYLKEAMSEEDFEQRYFELQIKSNLSSYTEFLNIG
ncbi:MAG: hypothetical protein MI810_03905 [Flavobacteriales bacterium]|nr:hypothetical protein [Flavobacteriales bacterium]